MQELWEERQNFVLFLTIHGEMKMTVDSSYDCVEHCPAAHGFQVMKAGDAREFSQCAMRVALERTVVPVFLLLAK